MRSPSATLCSSMVRRSVAEIFRAPVAIPINRPGAWPKTRRTRICRRGPTRFAPNARASARTAEAVARALYAPTRIDAATLASSLLLVEQAGQGPRSVGGLVNQEDTVDLGGRRIIKKK